MSLMTQALKTLAYRLRPRPPYSLTTDHGPMTIAHVDEYSQRWLYRSANNLNSWHEPSLSWLLLVAGMRGATTFLDIGAHLGYFSLLHTARSGNTAYALELDPKNFEILEEIVVRNGSEHVRIFNTGAADAPGEITMSAAYRPSPRVSLIRQSDGPDDQGCKVPLMRIDDFVAQQGVAPDVVKIDVEGAEYKVVSGAAGLLAGRRPLVAVEVHPTPMAEMDGITPDDFAEVMKGHGYAAFRFDDSRDRACSPLRPFSGWDGSTRDFDLVFVAAEDVESLVIAYNGALPELLAGRIPARA